MLRSLLGDLRESHAKPHIRLGGLGANSSYIPSSSSHRYGTSFASKHFQVVHSSVDLHFCHDRERMLNLTRRRNSSGLTLLLKKKKKKKNKDREQLVGGNFAVDDRARVSYRGNAAAMVDIGVFLELGAFSSSFPWWPRIGVCRSILIRFIFIRVVSSSFWDVSPISTVVKRLS